MDSYAANTDRPIDVLFVGGYSRHHRKRAVVLEAVSSLQDKLNIVFCLDRSRLTRLAESPIGGFLPLASHSRPADIRALSHAPVFGRELYTMISQAKIVLNGAVDMAGRDRGNMRCFEAMGCGSLLLSDEGNYPASMVAGDNLVTYSTPNIALDLISQLLKSEDQRSGISVAGNAMISEKYSKALQWERFVNLTQ
jgi:hypothetical protein